MIHTGLYSTTLSNGLKILTEEVPSVKSFALGVWVNVGTRDEDISQAGIAHFVEHMVFRGSSTRSSRQIATQFESFGGYVNAFTSKEQTCYYVRALSAHLSRSMELLADVVLSPAFRQKDVIKERAVIIEEIKSYDDEPEELIMDIGEQALFGKNTMGSPIIGTVESISLLTSKELNAFHLKEYTPHNMLIAVAGNITHEDVVRYAEKFFGATRIESTQRTTHNLKPTTHNQQRKRSLPRKQKAKNIVVNRAFQQSHILWLTRTAGAQSSDRYAYSLVNTLLGDGLSSRLNLRIREKHGSAYSVYSTLQLLTDCGILSLYAGCEHESVEKTNELIRSEIEALSTRRITKSELLRAKEQVKASIIMAMEDMSLRMQSLAKAELEELTHEDMGQTIQAIDSVTNQDVSAVAGALSDPAGWTSVIITNTTSSEEEENE
jgi:predicted Zn-dependent peptidase